MKAASTPDRVTVPLWIKICGLQTPRAIEAAASAGADAVGFVFHAESPRHLEPAAARELARAVPPGVQTVAVFRHPVQALVDDVLDLLHPDWLQTDIADLATLELPAALRLLPVFRAAAVAAPGMTGPGASGHRRFLLEGAQSGAGELTDWTMAASFASQGELVLAGGLDDTNVAAAIAAVRPFGVDVSSGVESARGVKAPDRIREFISVARAAHRELAAHTGGVQST